MKWNAKENAKPSYEAKLGEVGWGGWGGWGGFMLSKDDIGAGNNYQWDSG